MAKYDELICPRCKKETLHRIKNKYGSKGGKSFLKYQAKHCLVCNHYWGYKERTTRTERKKETIVSLR